MRSMCPSSIADPSSGGAKTQTRVPTELLGKTSSRLYWLALLVLVTTAVLFVARHFLEPEFRSIERQPAFLAAIALLTLTSAGVIAIHRLGFLPAGRVLELGIAFEILIAFGLSSLEFSRKLVPQHASLGISALPMWILVFGIFVPNTPLRTLIASLVSASAAPVAYALNRYVVKIPAWDASELALWFVPSFLMAGWTYFLSRDLYQMEIAINNARDMGSYALEKLLGKGGMGEVWAARHRRLCSGAAIKLIRPEVLVEKTGREAHVLRRRFEQEAKATAGLRSPHTVALHDFGVAEDGSFYYAMELLEGLDLEDLIERFGPQPPVRVAKILRQVCDSLAEAHNHGLIHRDIKPSNVFLARLGVNCDFVKVLDFGLVKGEQAGSTRLTLAGTTAGTPAYMAPELATGAAFDGRADLYSLGCIGYYLLTGTPVFEESTPVAVAIAHVQKQPVPPSQRTELAVPRELEDVIMRCLAKEPAHRPQTAGELSRALAGFENDTSWRQEDAERWWRTHLPEHFTADESPDAEALSIAN
jgi:eukaryotic-like serine/threonine-protein kinase